MATRRIPILGSPAMILEDGIFQSQISSQGSWTNEIGDQACIVMPDPAGGGDIGFSDEFDVPAEYVDTPIIRVRGIVDGAPGASDVLGFTLQGISLADNEAADAAFSTADLANKTIGSSGDGYSDKDRLDMDITLSNLVPSVSEALSYRLRQDDTVTTFVGNFLCTAVFFIFNDA